MEKKQKGFWVWFAGLSKRENRWGFGFVPVVSVEGYLWFIWWYGFLMLCCGGSMVVGTMLSCCYSPDYLQKQTKIDKGEGEGKHWRAAGSILNGVFAGDSVWSRFKGLVLKNGKETKGVLGLVH
ncbi:hypothetical protein H5410_035662 [Solanum commersonii]|uniref:Uncharacterized protein n=1 Tax=Solanum commersonii TaxID=4109 RepID=A0A9J5Y5U0_SOLCO|nr:hypothetical protein H5410_035662 [Solanum commersonii]